MKSHFYVYLYLDPRRPGHYTYQNFVTFLYEPFYVGKGCKNRYRQHVTDAKTGKLKKHHRINKIIDSGYNPIDYVVMVQTNVYEITAKCKECLVIHLLGREDTDDGPLLNRTIGGDGSCGYKHTDDFKQSVSIRHTGKVISSETRQKMSDCHKGKQLSGETKQKLSIANKGKILTDETRQKISNTTKGKLLSEEHKQKLRKPKSEQAKANMRKPKSEEYKANMRNKPKVERVCPHCGQTGIGLTMSRWHFNNCKSLVKE